MIIRIFSKKYHYCLHFSCLDRTRPICFLSFKTDIDRELEDLEVELPEIDTPKFDITMPEFDSDILKDLDTKNNK